MFWSEVCLIYTLQLPVWHRVQNHFVILFQKRLDLFYGDVWILGGESKQKINSVLHNIKPEQKSDSLIYLI